MLVRSPTSPAEDKDIASQFEQDVTHLLKI
jgi:hypothetical protein